MVYDAIIVIALWMLAAALAMLAGFPNRTALQDPAYTLYLALVWFMYLAFFWRRGMTVGMRAWRVSIIGPDGRPPGWKACTVRYLVSLLSMAAAGIGFLWSLVDNEKRCWHELASGTRLIRN
jgi:uncharacterized RDD family membrane protein YckC